MCLTPTISFVWVVEEHKTNEKKKTTQQTNQIANINKKNQKKSDLEVEVRTKFPRFIINESLEETPLVDQKIGANPQTVKKKWKMAIYL